LSFTRILLKSIEDVFDGILNHRFIVGLTDGTLSVDCFKHYVVQDALYLREYSKALALLAAKAPRDDWIVTFADHAKIAIVTERALHDSFFKEWGLREEEVYLTPMSPTNTAYTSYLTSTVLLRSFHEALGAMLPCYWIYLEVGKRLEKEGSPNQLYRRWIATYSSREFESVTKVVLNIMDDVAESLNGEEKTSVLKRFRTTSIFEYLFWDSAYRMEAWPFKMS